MEPTIEQTATLQSAADHKLICTVVDSTEMTVGQSVVLECTQPSPALVIKPDTSLRVVNDQYKYVFVPRSLNQDEKGLHLTVTSYVPGSYQLKDIELLYGSEKVIINEASLNVKSVIAAAQSEEKPKPYPMQTASLSWPMSFTIAIVGLFIFIVLLVLVRMSKKIKYKKFQDEIDDYDVALSAEQQVYKSLRKLDTENYPAANVETVILVYLTRKLRINFIQHDLNTALSLFKDKYPLQGALRQELKMILKDIKQLKMTKQLIDKSMLQKIYELIDTVEAHL